MDANETKKTDESPESDKLDSALADTFPASDPPAMVIPVPCAPLTGESSTHGAVPAEGERIHTYAVVHATDVADLLDADKAATSGRRWTSDGAAVLYTSASKAGALLEFLAHADSSRDTGLVLVRFSVPALQVGDLVTPPPEWRGDYTAEVRAIGDEWLRSAASLGLRVPSALCPGEHNVVLNLSHADRELVSVVMVEDLWLDPRIGAGLAVSGQRNSSVVVPTG